MGLLKLALKFAKRLNRKRQPVDADVRLSGRQVLEAAAVREQALGQRSLAQAASGDVGVAPRDEV